ncbi:hypothetical protein GOBAR_DD22339 [Gossypium barbadense]|nr:hypothetical protein GOBAR_DD22339 [Gossypium barbadense]
MVKGPLGIVSWMELSFLTMFVVLLAWSTTSYLNGMFTHIDQMASRSGLLVWEAKLEMSGLTLGLVGNICLAFLFFPVTRGSSVLRLIGLSSEASIKYQIWVGHIAMTIFTAHGLCYLVFWAKTEQLSQQRVSLVAARILPCQTVELNFCKSPEVNHGPRSIIFVNVPAISKLQWHPFTITSNSNMDTDKLSMVVKSEGRWSSDLYQKLSSPLPMDGFQVSIEGPYGPPASTHLLRHDILVLLSGGSGITPFISIIRELLFKASSGSSTRIPHILLICAYRLKPM